MGGKKRPFLRLPGLYPRFTLFRGGVQQTSRHIWSIRFLWVISFPTRFSTQGVNFALWGGKNDWFSAETKANRGSKMTCFRQNRIGQRVKTPIFGINLTEFQLKMGHSY
jgi:hypothetical protein